MPKDIYSHDSRLIGEIEDVGEVLDEEANLSMFIMRPQRAYVYRNTSPLLVLRNFPRLVVRRPVSE